MNKKTMSIVATLFATTMSFAVAPIAVLILVVGLISFPQGVLAVDTTDKDAVDTTDVDCVLSEEYVYKPIEGKDGHVIKVREIETQPKGDGKPCRDTSYIVPLSSLTVHTDKNETDPQEVSADDTPDTASQTVSAGNVYDIGNHHWTDVGYSVPVPVYGDHDYSGFIAHMQSCLNKQGYLVAEAKQGSVGHESNSFLDRTRKAIKSAQSDRDSEPTGKIDKVILDMMKECYPDEYLKASQSSQTSSTPDTSQDSQASSTPVDCKVTKWSKWFPHTKSPGGFVRERQVARETEGPENGGKPCEDRDKEQVRCVPNSVEGKCVPTQQNASSNQGTHSEEIVRIIIQDAPVRYEYQQSDEYVYVTDEYGRSYSCLQGEGFLGALIGGAAFSHLGKGNGRIAWTAFGALAGCEWLR